LSKNLGQTAGRLVRFVIRGSRKLVRDPVESTLILRMAAWVSVLSLLVKFQPLPRALWIVSLRAPRASAESTTDTERKLAQAIDLLLGTQLLIFKPICWKRAAILHRYLALNGIATRIVFGIRKTADGGVDGHAWLEVAGKAILEPTVPNYKVTYTFPSHDVCNLELSSLTNGLRNRER
jgi:Transglutaminase-like superfamily